MLASCGRPPLPSDVITTTTTGPDPDPGGDTSDPPQPPDPPILDVGAPEPGCFEAPPECLRFVECIAALIPSQADVIEQVYGESGACWCGTEGEAQECFTTCIEQLDTALDSFPTEPACHEQSCSLDELDPEQPYGPVVDGQCPEGSEPLINPLGVPGSVCSQLCGIGGCLEHSQTSAVATCYVPDNWCVTRCWVDPRVVGGNQCQCGARCQPHGAPDSEGNMRGICTFE